MKQIFLLAIVFLATKIVSAQAYEGTVEYDKKKQRTFIVEYPFPPEVVEAAIIDKMEKAGHKAKSEKGLFNSDKGAKVFKNEYVDEINGDRMDYVFKVERKSKKESDKSVVYMIMMKDGANNIEKLDIESLDKAKSFLNGLTPNVEASHLEFKIKDQESTVGKAEKKLKKLQDDQKEMEGKIKKLQEDLEENAKDQENTSKDITTQQETLQSLKAKRKS